MIRNRKKLNTITKSSVTNAARTLPPSQRALTRRASFLDLQRLAIMAAARPRAEEPAPATQDDRRQDGEAPPLPPPPLGGGSRPPRPPPQRRVRPLGAGDVAAGG